jgi:hypothetical protein
MKSRPYLLLFALFPHLLAVHYAMGLCFPNFALGSWHTAVIDVARGVGLLALVLWWLMARRVVERPSPIHRWTPAILVAGWCVLPFAFVAAHFALGTADRYPSDCDGLEGLRVEVCQGRDHSVGQGRYGYHRASGTAHSSTCDAFRQAQILDNSRHDRSADEAGPRTCEASRPREWRAYSCELLGIPADWRCYSCARWLSTNDAVRHMLAYDLNCARAAHYVTVNEELSIVPRRLDAFFAPYP